RGGCWRRRRWDRWMGAACTREPPARPPPRRIRPRKAWRELATPMPRPPSMVVGTGTPIPAAPGRPGADLLPCREGHPPTTDRTRFWRGGSTSAGPAGIRQQTAVRSGDWKLLIDQGRPFLFNVRTDLGERTNLIRSHSDLARQLRAKLNAWQKDVDAEAK